MAEPLRVVLAEDNYLVREGTRQLLEAAGDVDVLAAVGSGGELVDAARRLRPDAAMTDIRMCRPHTRWRASRRRTRSAPSILTSA